jgi:hypothetical protein
MNKLGLARKLTYGNLHVNYEKNVHNNVWRQIISFIQILIQWLKICSLNMELMGGEGFKPSHLHFKLMG